MTRIALVRLSALGDIVHTWPLAEALRQARPDCEITWIVEQPLVPLAEGHPAIGAVVQVATRKWRRSPLSTATRQSISETRKALKEKNFDVCLDPQGVLKSAIVASWTNAPTRIGLAKPWRRELVAGYAYTETIHGGTGDQHVIRTNLEFLKALEGSPPEEEMAPDGTWLRSKWAQSEINTAPAPHYAVILPGAGHPDKVLEIETLASVASRISESVGRVVVAWGPGEEDRARAIVESSCETVELAPPTDLLQLGQLLDCAQLVIGGDTGPVHLAASLETPTLAVFLSTNWRRNGPKGLRTAVVSAASSDSDSPSGSARARRVRDLSADEIVQAAERLLAHESVT